MPEDIVSLSSQWEHIQTLEFKIIRLETRFDIQQEQIVSLVAAVEELKKIVQELASRPVCKQSSADVLP